MSGSQLHWIQARPADKPALQAWILVCCSQPEISLCCSEQWLNGLIQMLDVWRSWTNGHFTRMPNHLCRETAASTPQPIRYSVCKCAVRLTQLGCVGFALRRHISCAAAITEPNAFGPASVGRYIQALLGLRGLWHCFYLGLSVAWDSPLPYILSSLTDKPSLAFALLSRQALPLFFSWSYS